MVMNENNNEGQAVKNEILMWRNDNGMMKIMTNNEIQQIGNDSKWRNDSWASGINEEWCVLNKWNKWY